MLTECQKQELCDMMFDGNELIEDVVRELGIDPADYSESDDERESILAVCQEFGVRYSDCSVDGKGNYGYGYTISADGAEYWVCTDDEANDAWEEVLESYLDEGCVPGADSPYFDRERWKADARHDSRGHALSSYDGHEYEVKINDTYYCIYRTN